ncbi:DUF308 domain-containing protein [Kribbella sp. NBC_01510]|uniref:DUF308 domain-containing protein n=1 Tax=Kribbella sp. NBC_01510 TaxID=2903581 RepID=UPI003866D775
MTRDETSSRIPLREAVQGIWAVRSWGRSLLTLVTVVGVWAVFYRVNEIFAAFALREAARRPSGWPADHHRFEKPASLPRPAAVKVRRSGTKEEA